MTKPSHVHKAYFCVSYLLTTWLRLSERHLRQISWWHAFTLSSLGLFLHHPRVSYMTSHINKCSKFHKQNYWYKSYQINAKPLRSCCSSDAYLYAKMPKSLHGVCYLCAQRRPMKNSSTRKVGGSTLKNPKLTKQCHISRPLSSDHFCRIGGQQAWVDTCLYSYGPIGTRTGVRAN